MKRIGALVLSAALSLSLCVLPAGAAEDTSQWTETVQAAAQAAMGYSGAQSIQYALWQDGAITLTGHTGSYSRTENRALTDDILYGIGSVSKMYTTAAVLQLEEEGKVDLDQPVCRYLPDFRMEDPRYTQITVRMLLNHSSGLAGSTVGSGFLLNDPDTVAADTLLERLSTQSLKDDPGAFSVYCNDGFTLAELLVEAVSDMEFEVYVRRNILEPAGLENTYFPGEAFESSLLAKTYLSAEDSRAMPQETFGVHGTGGIYASASDLAAFGGQVWCEDGILSASSRTASLADEYARGIWPEDTESSLSYGLGWDSVHWYPFAYDGIQAAAKGGDTILYHGGLVVIPEYHMAAAVLSSGGISTYNEMLAGQILLAALEAQGVRVDQSTHTLPAAQPAQMPAELTAYSGLYSSSSQVVAITVGADGTLSVGSQNLRYYSDGSFRDEEQNMMVKFITEENGQTYFWQKAYGFLPSLGEMPTSLYTYIKLPENRIDPVVQAAWDARNGKLYLALTEKYSSVNYALGLPAAGLATDPVAMPGYMAFDRIVDENHAVGTARIPGTGGRDWQNLSLFQKDGVEYLELMGWRYVDAGSIPALYGGASSWTTIQQDGYARWYQIGPSAAGKTMHVQVPEQGSFAVYNADGALTASSWVYGDSTAILPEGGWVVFAGAPGARFPLTLKGN